MRRALAWSIDFGLIAFVAIGLGYATYERIVSPASGASAEVVSGFRDLVSSGFAIGDVAADTGPSVWREVSWLLIQGFVALVVIQFLYQFVALAWTGRTLGKALVDLRVNPAVPGAADTRPGVGAAARRAAVTTISETGLYSLACCVLLSGQVVLSVLCWLLAVAAFWGNALPTLGRNRRSLADLVGGTTVSGGRMYRAVADGVTYGSQVAAAQVTRGLSESERAKQLWESQRAQQLRQAGQGAAERGRQAWKRLRKTDGQGQQAAQLPYASDPSAAGTVPQPPTGYAPGQPAATAHMPMPYPPPGHPAIPPTPGHPEIPPDSTSSPYALPNPQPNPGSDSGAPPVHEAPPPQSSH